MSLASQNTQMSTWSGTLDLPTGTAPGSYNVTYFGVDCASGRQLTWDGYQGFTYNVMPYVVDLSPPSVVISAPVVGHTTVQGHDTGPSADGQTRVVGSLEVDYTATDGVGLYSATITVTGSDGSSSSTTEYLSGKTDNAQCSSFGMGCFVLSPGQYTVTVVVTDVGGLVSTPASESVVEVTS